jgi:hypothetical protein
VIVDGPTLHDATVSEAIHERCVPGVGPGRDVKASERAARPRSAAHAELDDEIVLGDDGEVLPTEGAELLAFSRQPLGACPRDALACGAPRRG